MTSRQTEIYTCDGCGKRAEGAEYEGNGPVGWLDLEHWDDASSCTRLGDFCSERCCLRWLTKRLPPDPDVAAALEEVADAPAASE